MVQNPDLGSILKSLYIRNLFNVDGPKGSTKAVSHIEGSSPWVTCLNLDQWPSR